MSRPDAVRLENDFATNQSHVGGNAIAVISVKNRVSAREILLLVSDRLLLQKSLERESGGIATRKPGNTVTGFYKAQFERQFPISHDRA